MTDAEIIAALRAELAEAKATDLIMLQALKLLASVALAAGDEVRRLRGEIECLKVEIP